MIKLYSLYSDTEYSPYMYTRMEYKNEVTKFTTNSKQLIYTSSYYVIAPLTNLQLSDSLTSNWFY